MFTTVSPQVLVWSLVTAVSRRALPGLEEARLGQVAPRFTWTAHALPVTGLHVGHGPAHSARVVTASLDMPVKLYSMTTGDHLLQQINKYHFMNRIIILIPD